MRLNDHAALDALCGEYVVGTLRGPARRRFERALRDEPRVALRLRRWQAMVPAYSDKVQVQPSREVWNRLEKDLELARYGRPWHRREGFWMAWAAAASVLLIIAFVMQITPRERALVQIAELTGTDSSLRVSARRSADGRTLALRATRSMVAPANASYELWLVPAEGGDPVSLGVLGALDAELPLAEAHRARLKGGDTLAVSSEPAGGSPTGKPTGAVILQGRISL
jgi:anti-sigma-K factor RskA